MLKDRPSITAYGYQGADAIDVQFYRSEDFYITVYLSPKESKALRRELKIAEKWTSGE